MAVDVDLLNRLSIIGPDEALDRFVRAARGRMPPTGDTPDSPNAKLAELRPMEVLCFHSFVPLPPEYSQVPYRGDGDTGWRTEMHTWDGWGAVDTKRVRERELLTYRFKTRVYAPSEFLARVAPSWPELKFFLTWGGPIREVGRAVFGG